MNPTFQLIININFEFTSFLINIPMCLMYYCVVIHNLNYVQCN